MDELLKEENDSSQHMAQLSSEIIKGQQLIVTDRLESNQRVQVLCDRLRNLEGEEHQLAERFASIIQDQKALGLRAKDLYERKLQSELMERDVHRPLWRYRQKKCFFYGVKVTFCTEKVPLFGVCKKKETKNKVHM